MELFKAALRKTFREIRQETGKTQSEIEEAFDVPARYWGKIELGYRNNPNAYTLFRMYKKGADINKIFRMVSENIDAMKSEINKEDQ